MTTLIVSFVTPCHVEPPLSPCQNAMHGGDWGSSVWRGGSPTHCSVTGRTVVGGAANRDVLLGGPLVVVVPPGNSPAPPAPEPNRLVWCEGAWVICLFACGLISAIAGGGVDDA